MTTWCNRWRVSGRQGFIVLLTALVAASCGGGGRDDARPMSAMLSLVPDTEDARRLVVINDFAAARDALGLEQPDAGDDEAIAEHVVEFARAGVTEPSEISGWGSVQFDAWRDELGFSPIDIEQDVTAGASPELIQALVGRFDRQAVEEALESDPTWSDALETAEHDGTEYWQWGQDSDMDLERISPARRRGESARMALIDDTLLWARSTASIERLIDAADGGDSLADDDAFSDMAAALDEAEAYAAVLSDEPIPPDPRATPAQRARGGPTLGPYLAYGSGAAGEADDRLMILVLAHADDEAAEDNVARLRDVVEEGVSRSTRRPWRDVLDIADLRADGRLVVAVLRTEQPGLWATHVFQRDSLLTTE